jgi:hypothetical protein
LSPPNVAQARGFSGQVSFMHGDSAVVTPSRSRHGELNNGPTATDNGQRLASFGEFPRSIEDLRSACNGNSRPETSVSSSRTPAGGEARDSSSRASPASRDVSTPDAQMICVDSENRGSATRLRQGCDTAATRPCFDLPAVSVVGIDPIRRHRDRASSFGRCSSRCNPISH